MLLSPSLSAETDIGVTLSECLVATEKNYPLIRQYALIEKTKEYSVANAKKGYLPNFTIGGSSTYQSETVHLPNALPGMPMPDKDQHKIYGEVSQSLTDLFIVGNQKEYAATSTQIEREKVKIELHKIRERIHHLFFGVLLIDAQIRQVELLSDDLKHGLDRIKSAVANGTALQSASDNLTAELLKTKQRTTELTATRKGYVKMLSLFTGTPFDNKTRFAKPPPGKKHLRTA